MTAAEQMTVSFSADDIAGARDWPAAMPRSGADARVGSCGGNWAIRRAIVRARSALLRAQLEEAAQAIAQLSRLLSNHPHSDRVPYSRVLRILQACRLAAGDDFLAARSALAALSPLRGDIVSATILRYVDWKSGAREQAGAPEAFDYLTVSTRGQAVYEILNLCMSAAMAFDRLHLSVCATLAAEALQSAQQHYGNHSPMSCFPATLLAQVAYEQGRFEEAEALLSPRLQVIRASGLPECYLRATVLLSRLSFHRGQHRAALAILREAEAFGRVRRWPRVVSVASSEYARSLVLRRYEETPGSERCTSADSAAEPALWQGFPLGDAPQFSTIALTLGRIAATACRGSGNDCHDALLSCLRIGAAHGLRMIFVDAGQPILELLKSLYCGLAANATPTSDLRAYIATILKVTAPTAAADAGAPTYRHLSRRETGILKLIARGMSNKRIALSLGITPETVKTHTKSIFVKLATRTRAQAVARAEGIGWL